MNEQAMQNDATCTAGLRLLVFTDALPYRNGVGAYYSDLLSHLAEKVEHAEMFCPRRDETGKTWRLSFPMPGDSTQRIYVPRILQAVSLVRSVKPDVIVVAGPGFYGFLGLVLAKVFGATLCTGYHTRYDQLVAIYWKGLPGRVAGFWLRAMDRLFFLAARIVMANSHSMQSAAEEMGASAVRLVGTPVERRLLQETSDASEDPFGPVLFLGRLAPEKRLELLLDAARALPETRFIVAGDGPLRSKVEETADELPNLEYRGWVHRAQLAQLLDECEILVLPSSVEAFGTVVIEAMARRRMALVSRRCGVRNWADLGKAIEVIGEEEDTADVLRRLRSIPRHERQRRALHARTCVERFVNRTIGEWLEALGDAAEVRECLPQANARQVGELP